MSDRYLKILPFVALVKDAKITLTAWRTFTVMCDMADEDGYVVDPENYFVEIGMAIRPTKIKSTLGTLKRLGWISLVEEIKRHNIWKIMLEPHQASNVKKFIVEDGSLRVTIESVGQNEWWNKLKETQTTTINQVDWSD